MTFTLGTDVLGGAGEFNYYETIIEDRGRSIIIDYTQTTGGTDIEILGYSVRYYPAEETPQEQV